MREVATPPRLGPLYLAGFTAAFGVHGDAGGSILVGAVAAASVLPVALGVLAGVAACSAVVGVGLAGRAPAR